MMPLSRSFSQTALKWVCTGALLATTACELPTEAPTVDAVQFAKGGGGPSVEAAIPSEGAQGTVNLQVRVTGSGFDNGSNAVWLRDGAPAPDVTTSSTTYVSRNELLADITIDAAAVETLYDIEVTTKRGKKGVGVELFSVKKPGEVAPTFSVEMTELGQFEGRSSAQSISTGNGVTHIVGSSEDLTDPSNSFVWHMTLGGDPTPLTCIGPDVGWCHGASVGINGTKVNSNGQILGSQRTYNAGADYFYGRAASWESASAPNVRLPEPAYAAPNTVVVSGAHDLSNTGYAVGHVTTSTNPDAPGSSDRTTRAVLWYDDPSLGWTVRDLHAEIFEPLGEDSSWPAAVNDDGVVVGHGWILRDGLLTWLPDVEWTGALNNADPIEVVGRSQYVVDEKAEATVWRIAGTDVTRVKLPTPGTKSFDGSIAWDVNDHGDIVGDASAQSGPTAVLWVKDTSAPGGYWPVELGTGHPWAIDSATLDRDGVIRIVGETTVSGGKGRNATTRTVPVLWTVTRSN